MVADLVKDMADVTIYGDVCEYCGDQFETLDDQVRHTINEHDEAWKFDEAVEEALKAIKIDRSVIDNLEWDDDISVGGDITCNYCVNSYKQLDDLLVHMVFEHGGQFFREVFVFDGFYLYPGFLFKNGFVDENLDP